MTSTFTAEFDHFYIEGVSIGFISFLGIIFVTVLYEAIAEDENSFGFVALENGEVLGFIAFSVNLGKLYKYVALKKSLKFGSPEESITPTKMKRLKTLAACYGQAHSNLPAAWRIDIMAIELGARGDLLRIEQIENAVGGD